MTIIDYLRETVNKSFRDLGFNIADNFCLSALAYYDFSGIGDRISGGESMKLSDLAKELDFSAIGIKALADFPPAFLQLMAESRRFSETWISDYINVFDTEKDCQFAAYKFTLDSGDIYCAFRGTDTSIIGWKEDFLLACGETAAQRSAVKWLEHAVKNDPEGAALYVGGHSKGGNLAVYAAAYAKDDVFDRIRTVYSNDGPGLCRDVIPDERVERVRPLVVKTVPGFSVVGMLMPDGIPYRIVKSSGKNMYQHDIMTWQLTDQGRPDYADDLSPEVRRINAGFRKWIDGEDMEHRKIFIDNIFDAMAEEGAVDLSGAASVDGIERLIFAVAKGKSIRSTVRNLLTSFYHAFTDPYSENYYKVAALLFGSGMIALGAVLTILADYAYMIVGAGLSLLIFVTMIGRLFHNVKRPLERRKKAALVSIDLLTAILVPIFAFSASNVENASSTILGIGLFSYGVYAFTDLMRRKGSRVDAYRFASAVINSLLILSLPVSIAEVLLVVTGINIVILGFLHIYTNC